MLHDVSESLIQSMFTFSFNEWYFAVTIFSWHNFLISISIGSSSSSSSIHLSDDLRDPALSSDSFRRLLKTRLFSEY